VPDTGHATIGSVMTFRQHEAVRQHEAARQHEAIRQREAVLSWYSAHRRDLPWRRPGASPWAVLVSEVMLQQTPVARVLPAYHAWLQRWPTPAALAGAPAGEAVRQWGRLGYPRRALRLHAVASILARQYGGEVPACHAELLDLPGIGSYTAAAVASFAFGQRHAVLDTNVRRVLARLVTGNQFPSAHLSAAEARLAESLLPADPGVASRWSVALMELGALVCTAARPRCTECPVAADCSWRLAGQPQREAQAPVSAELLAAAWPDPSQQARALDGLVADGLAEVQPDGAFSLPGTGTAPALPGGANSDDRRSA
jgi:A/G-specific adenine glycosylase